MKYIIVILGIIILSLYAGLDNRIKTISDIQAETVILKTEVSYRTGAINLLENYHKTLKPPRYLPLGWPMVSEEYDDLTSYWAYRNDPLRRNTGGSNKNFHAAVDMTGIKGAQVLAVAGGIVLEKWYEKGTHYVGGGWSKFGGHKYFNGYITIQHDDGMISHYVHVSDILVHEGERVNRGQPIARISRQVDKFSTGPHLDFRLQNESGGYVNPLLWIGLNEEAIDE